MTANASDLKHLKVSTAEDDRSFEQLEPEWNDLWQRSHEARFHQRYDWCAAAWHECLRQQGYKLHVVSVRRQGRLVAVLPLVRKDRMLRRPDYRFLSCLEHPKDVLVDRQLAATRSLRDLFLLMMDTCSGRIRISPVRKASLLHDVAEQANFTMKPALDAHVAALPNSDIETFVRQRSKSLLGEERRGFKKLLKKGPVSVSWINTYEEFDHVFADLVRLKRTWLLSKEKTSGWLSDDRAVAALRSYAKGAVAAGHAHLQCINVGSDRVAINLSLRDNATLTSFLNGYEPDFGHFGVGRLGMLAMMRRACADDVRVIDHLGGTNHLKTTVTNQIVQQYTLEIG